MSKKTKDFSKFATEVANQMKISVDFIKGLDDEDITTKEEF